MSLPLKPPYNVSYSTIRTAMHCERRAALAGPGAWQAWPRGRRAADPVARLCYEGKHLQALLPYLGMVIHRVAERVVREAVKTGRRPVFEELLEDVLSELRSLWQRPRGAFESDPKLGYLLSKYRGVPESPADIEKTKLRAAVALRRLLRASLLDDLADLERDDVVRTEELVQMPVVLDGLPPATFFGKADLVYTHRRALIVDAGIIAPGKRGIPIIADFKTGRSDGEEVVTQLSLLCLVLRANGLEPHPVAGYVGRVVSLSQDGPEEDRFILIGPTELTAAEAWVRRGLERVAAYPRDDVGQVELRKVPATSGVQCQLCPMLRACDAVDNTGGLLAS